MIKIDPEISFFSKFSFEIVSKLDFELGFVDGQTKSVKVYQDKHCVSNGAGAAFGGLTAILTMALVALW